MKVLVVCIQRTRSSFLIDAISQYYNLNNFWEPFGGSALVDAMALTSKNKNKKTLYEEYISVTKDLVDKTVYIDNFAAKAFTTSVLDWQKFNISRDNLDPDYTKITKDHILDFYSHYKVDMYDQVFVTKRKNMVDLYCSFYHAKQNSTFILYEKEEKKAKIYSAKNKILPSDYPFIKWWLVNEKVHDLITNKILNLRDNVTVLEYESMPDYVNTHFPNIKSTVIKTENNYQKNIKNYNQICEDFDRAKKDLQEQGVFDLLEKLFSQ